MKNTRNTHPNKRSRLDRAAIVAAAGISAALGLASTSSAQPSPMEHAAVSANTIRMTDSGVTLHSDRLAAALRKDKKGTVKALQARFPGLTTSQISVGANNMVSLKVSRAVFAGGHLAGDDNADNSVCNGGACSAPMLPGEEGFGERTQR
jgi:hypothetical protein